MTDVVKTEDIKKLAKLARIELTSEEEEKLAKEIGGILGYISQIQTAAGLHLSSQTKGGPNIREANVLGKDVARVKEPVRNAMREDKNPHETGINTDVIVAEFPRKEGNYLKVKKILG